MRVELIYNPNAGPVELRRELGFVERYLAHQDWEVTIHESKGPRHPTELAASAAQRGVDLVVAAGGDGTVNEVASGLIHSDTVLGVLPVGTTNVWALQMRIPAPSPVGVNSRLVKLMGDLEERIDYRLPLSYYRSLLLDAAQVLVEGQEISVDMGQANERPFLLWAGVGLDAAVTVNVNPQQKKAFGPLAFVGTTLDTVRDYKSAEVTLVLDGETHQVETSLIVVSNIQLYGGIFPIGARASVNDGKLDVCVFKGEGLINFVQHVLKVASRQHLADPMIEYMQCKEIIVESTKPFPVHVDDEPFAETPVTIRVLPRALKVIVPRNVPPGLFSKDSGDPAPDQAS